MAGPASAEGMEQIASLLEKREDLRPVFHFESRMRELIDIRYLFFLLLFLLSAEWLIRKLNGSI